VAPTLARFGVLLNAEYEHGALMEHARLIEELAFGTLWYADERFYREPYVGLAACALATERLKLGTGVTDPFTRHPALTAAAIASLDELSHGRAVLGFGSGISGYHNLGITLGRPAKRLREAIHILRGLLAGKRVTYEGETLSIRNGALKFEPYRTDLPIVLAGDGPLVLQLAGEVADAAMVAHCASPRILKSKLQSVRLGQQRSSRATPSGIVVRLDMTLAPDSRTALEFAKLRIGRVLWSRYPDRLDYLADHGLTLPPELDHRLATAGPFPIGLFDLEAFRQFADVIPDEFVYLTGLAGSPTDVAHQLDALFAAGATEIMAFPLLPPGAALPDVLRLYAEAAQATHIDAIQTPVEQQ
jgi:5,10-methylenetetrahydromethanopterin reductase